MRVDEYGQPQVLLAHSANPFPLRQPLHDARHTFASLLIDVGANPKAIQEYMGHASIQMTFDVYGHLIDGKREEVRTQIDAYLAASSPSPAMEIGESGVG